jgi:hypothetical protein
MNLRLFASRGVELTRGCHPELLTPRLLHSGYDASATTNEKALSGTSKREVKCKCGKAAKVCTVGKAGPNQGREFWGCMEREAKARCGFFKWAERDAPHSKRDLDLVWQVIYQSIDLFTSLNRLCHTTETSKLK